MRVADFDFDLPQDRIALRPVSPRDSARMLEVRGSTLYDWIMRDLPQRLAPGDVLVVNDTRVIPAQFSGTSGNAQVGITLHKREDLARWWAFVKNARRLKQGMPITLSETLTATPEARGEDGSWLLRFEADGPLEAAMAAAGTMPLPPYIASKRAIDEKDAEDYQTLHAKKDGAVAAPTAGLHFTPALWQALEARGVARETVTLHVGAGTFLPVKAEDTRDHKMHSEWGEIPADVAARLNTARASGGRIIAVGTTSLRVLESAATPSGLHPFRGDTDIFITPGYKFAAISGLITNFHLPKSTLFMLVSALMGLDTMRKAYAHAIAQNYRFYSYGDGSLLLP